MNKSERIFQRHANYRIIMIWAKSWNYCENKRNAKLSLRLPQWHSQLHYMIHMWKKAIVNIITRGHSFSYVFIVKTEISKAQPLFHSFELFQVLWPVFKSHFLQQLAAFQESFARDPRAFVMAKWKTKPLILRNKTVVNSILI